MALMTILWLAAYGVLVAYLANQGYLPPWAIAFAAGSIGATIAGLIALGPAGGAGGISLTLLPAIIAFPALAGGIAAVFVAVLG